MAPAQNRVLQSPSSGTHFVQSAPQVAAQDVPYSVNL